MLVELERLAEAFEAKGAEFADVLKVGRTQLQDAVPMTLGQELTGFGVTLRDEHAALTRLRPALWETNLGATAIGTGIAAPPGFPEAVRGHLAEITGFEIRTAPHLVEATTDMAVYVDVSSAAKRLALKLSKIANDLRLLSSGPQFGLGEIALPPRQAGSSIMPGTVNPVIPEAVNEVAFAVVGADLTVSLACEAGQLQLNAFGPVIASASLASLKWLTAGMITLRENCVVGIGANVARLAGQTASFVGVITAFTPYLGYATAATLAKQALATGADIADLVVATGLMTDDDVRTLMAPARLSGADTSTPVLSGLARDAERHTIRE
jgi:aspartate ammonia-lyase